MAERIKKLANVRADLEQYQAELEERVEIVQEENLKQMHTIRDTAQHLDRVLQVETRRREEQMVKTRQVIEATHAKVQEQLDSAIGAANARFEAERNRLKVQTQKLLLQIDVQENKVDGVIQEWRSSSSESTQMLKALVDAMRAKRIAEAGAVRQVLLDQTQQYKLRLEQWRVSSERLSANTATLAKARNKEYEGENFQGFQGSEQLVREMGDSVRTETSERMKGYNDIVGTLGQCTEIMQSAILQLGTFVKNAGQADSEKHV